jgi:signal transduction histidine kinase
VLANKRDLLRVISNIIHNAVKYSWDPRRGEPGEREVWVRLSERNTLYVLRVINLGVRVPEDELQLVFSSGYRGRLATDRGRLGTGIGLTDAKTVIENYGGMIHIESKPVSEPAAEGRAGEPPHLTTLVVTLPKYRGKP